MRITHEFRKYLEAQVARGGQTGATVLSVLAKYDSDQARDDHGRFASGGGGSKGDGWTPEKLTEAADKASAHADKLSRKADNNESTKAYQAAAEAHADAAEIQASAANAHHEAGNEDYASHHAGMAEGHQEMAYEHERDSGVDNGVADRAFEAVKTIDVDIEPDIYAI